MFYVPRGLMKRFSGGFLVSVRLSGTDLEYSIKILISNLFKFLLIWNDRHPLTFAVLKSLVPTLSAWERG